MPVVSVLWGLGLLTAISLSLLWNANISYSLAHNALEAATINATVEAGVNRAVAALLDSRPERQWRADGGTQIFEFNGASMTISIQDDLGKIDLNQAEVSLLVSLLQSVDVDADAAKSLADKIVDWRTATPFKRLNGAKEQDYHALGYVYQPRNGPYQSVDELLLVMNMTPELFQRIEPALTVYSGHQLIDPQVAPREALRALPNMTSDAVESALAARASFQSAVGSPVGGSIASLRGRAYTIRVEFERLGRNIQREITVRLTENPDQPFWPLNWKSR